MAGPGGIDPQLQQDTFSRPSTTQQTGATSHSSQHQSYFNAAGRGAINGFMAGGPWGALIGAAGSITTQAIANRQNKKAVAEANKNARDNAAEAFAREQGSQTAANEWNRESAQVSRFIEAGLSPGLMYGQMSDSSASAVSAPAAETVAPMASALEDPKLLEALGVYLQQLQTGSNVGLQSAQARNLDVNTQGTAIDNQTRNQRNLQEIQHSIASMQSLLASAGLSNAQKDRINRLLDSELDLMESQIGNYNASANLTNKQADELLPSQVASNYASARSSNAQATYTSGALTGKTNQETSLLKVQRDRGGFELVKDQDSYNWAYDWLDQHGYSGELAPQLLKFLDTAPSDVLKGGIQAIESWLDGGNWLKFIQEWRRTSSWRSNSPSDSGTTRRSSSQKKNK